MYDNNALYSETWIRITKLIMKYKIRLKRNKLGSIK